MRYCLSVRPMSGYGGVSCGSVWSMPANDAKLLKNLSAVSSKPSQSSRPAKILTDCSTKNAKGRQI